MPGSLSTSVDRLDSFNGEQEEPPVKWILAVALNLAGVVSVQAYTCADVRGLSRAQQAYYIKLYNITPEQQERIRQACYGRGLRGAMLRSPIN